MLPIPPTCLPHGVAAACFFLATADRNLRLPLCWRAPSCRQKYRKTWRNVTHPSDVSASRCRGSLFSPSNSGQESSAAAVLACAIVPSEKQTRGRAWLESHVYLSIDLSINLSINLSICLSIYHVFYPSIYRANYLSIYLSICLSINQILSLSLYIYLSLYLSICLPVYLSIYLSMSLPIYFSICLGI